MARTLRRSLARALTTAAVLAAVPAVAHADATFVCDNGATGHTYTAGPGSTVMIDALHGDSYCSMTGTIPQGATVVLEHGAGVAAGSSAENDGVLEFDGGTSGLETSGTLINTGTLEVTAGTAQINASAVQNSGVLDLPSGTSIALSGSLTELAGSTLAVGVDGRNASNVGSLTAGGPATLGGTLEVEPAAGYSPTAGTSQLLLTAFSVSGEFAATTGGNDRGFFAVEYAADTVTLDTSAPAVASIGKVSATAGRVLSVEVKVSCPRGKLICSPVSLTVGTAGRHSVTVASGKVSLAAGRSRLLTMRLNAAGVKRYRAAGFLRVHLVATAAGRQLSRQTVTVPGVSHGGG